MRFVLSSVVNNHTTALRGNAHKIGVMDRKSPAIVHLDHEWRKRRGAGKFLNRCSEHSLTFIRAFQFVKIASVRVRAFSKKKLPACMVGEFPHCFAIRAGFPF